MTSAEVVSLNPNLSAELRAHLSTGGEIVENAWAADLLASQLLIEHQAICSVYLWVRVHATSGRSKVHYVEYTRKPRHTAKVAQARVKGFAADPQDTKGKKT
jgi:hypothetical protein